MREFGSYAFIGFCVGLIWGVGCALALLYSIYLAGYRKGIRESSSHPETEKPSQEGREKVHPLLNDDGH
jgi:hypothetical protein